MLKLYSLPADLPGTTEELLKLLDDIVPQGVLRPGQDVAQSYYQSGARDLVDILIQRFELGANGGEEHEENWYDYDPDMKAYIEGGE